MGAMAMTGGDLELDLLLEAIYRRFHYDFRRYSPASIARRLDTAMTRLECATLSQVQDRILHEPAAFGAVLDVLTVPVSEMFRDPAYFAAIRRHAVPLLRTYPSLRIWVAGCSTGEEAYSMAVPLREEGLLARSIIYATDINPRTLAVAEAGVYEAARVPGVTRNHQRSGGRTSLADHHTAAYDRVVFDAALRRHMVFSDHGLATDSVFAEVHLVSCRNVLIYFDRELQARACTAVDLGTLVRRTVDEHRVAFPDRRVEIALHGDLAGTGDADRLSQLASNLIGNALVHGRSEDPVEVCLDGSRPDGVTFVVSNGGAIDPLTLPRLFDPFHGGDRTRGRGGLGLGLYISRQIARAHGGRIQVERPRDDRTVFRVDLPRLAPVPTADRADPRVRDPGRTPGR
jgi:chemotaxis protein methyltransferase CheR